jgi:hypothetical protein
LNTPSGNLWKAVVIGIAVIPITMATCYLLMLAFDHWNMPTASRAAAWIFVMVWGWPIVVYDTWLIAPDCGWECRSNRHGLVGLSIFAPIPYVLMAYVARWRSATRPSRDRSN